MKRCAVVAVIFLFACFLMPSGQAFAVAVKANLDPAVRTDIENELAALADEIRSRADLDKTVVFTLLTAYLQKHPSIFGTAFAFAPKKERGKEVKSAPYVYRSGDRFIKKDLSESYNYTAPNAKWYSIPVKLKKPVWSKPYYDKGGGEAWMVTYSIPVYADTEETRLIGVVTSDVLIQERK